MFSLIKTGRECYCGRPLTKDEEPCCKKIKCKYCKRTFMGQKRNQEAECCAFCWSNIKA